MLDCFQLQLLDLRDELCPLEHPTVPLLVNFLPFGQYYVHAFEDILWRHARETVHGWNRRASPGPRFPDEDPQKLYTIDGRWGEFIFTTNKNLFIF